MLLTISGCHYEHCGTKVHKDGDAYYAQLTWCTVHKRTKETK